MIKCAVVGGSGYIGGELIRLLLLHPQVQLVAVTANEAAGYPLAKVHPNLSHIDKKFNPLYEVADADVIFLALPHGKAMEIFHQFSDKRIIDTSADFRLRDLQQFEAFYKKSHVAFDQIASFTYGLPELFRKQIQTAKHISAPGCFATAAILSIYPLVAEGLHHNMVINAVTGSSGSGIKPNDSTHHPQRADSYFAYELFTHRHIPEIKQAIADATGKKIEIIFQPHSGPFVRGLYTTSIINLNKEITTERLKEIYHDYYLNECFIRFKEDIPNIKWIAHTNFCDITVKSDGKTAIVITAIDNLLKGGAGQALQCFNLLQGFAENTGLNFMGSNP